MGRFLTLFSGLSQRTKLVGLFAALLAVLFVALATWLPARVDQQSRLLVETRAQDLARLAAASAEPALDFDDPENAARMLGNLRLAGGAAYAMLARENGEVLAAWGVPAGGVPLPPTGGQELLNQGGLLHVRMPLATRGGHGGALLVGYRLEELEAHRQETRRFVAGACAVVLSIGLLATFLIGTWIVRPLRDIAGVARRIAGGEISAAADLPLVRGDEAGSVARALSQMLQRLYQHQATIEALAANLEQRVAERTRELEDANRLLADRLAQLKTTQEQLIIADRRVSIGRLAAGVAHEINNPLAFIKANLRFAGEELRALAARAREGGAIADLQQVVAELGEAIAESHQGAERVHQIVRGLKTFARTDEDRRTPVRVGDALAAAIDMSAHELKQRARLEREFGPAPLVDGNEVRLSQVFLNLLLNAAQALGDDQSGVIRVKLRTDHRGWAVASVQDTGIGIPKDHLSRIFDPFFTTKPVGVGTGLGLSISQGIVLAMGGEITVESEEGVGTTFSVALPPSTGIASEPAAPPAHQANGSERTVLVVDDELMVGAAVRRALGRQHHVTVATSGREALDLVRGGTRFDHILCDLMMPEMTGMDLYAELSRIAPDQAAVVTFMSGGAFTERAMDFAMRHGTRCLEKPFEVDQLRRILDDHA